MRADSVTVKPERAHGTYLYEGRIGTGGNDYRSDARQVMSEKIGFGHEFLFEVKRDRLVRKARRMAERRERMAALPRRKSQQKDSVCCEDGQWKETIHTVRTAQDRQDERKVPHRNTLRSNRLGALEALHQLRQNRTGGRIEIGHQAEDVTDGCPVTRKSTI